MSRDPIEEVGAVTQNELFSIDLANDDGDFNPYQFVANAPLEFVDVLGLALDRREMGKKKSSCKSCKCIGVTISYTPKLKNGKLAFKFYKNPNTKVKQYGFILHVYWTVDGDPSLCTYGVNEPYGGVTGSDPKGPVIPSGGTKGAPWISVPQKWDDHPGIPLDTKGWYFINVNLVQTYACWNSDADPQTQAPSTKVGPKPITGSGTRKY